jgi:hypothetical protein
VRQRYLFAIEDPFELDHNVARPVTHNGIVTIRDEFRRAWRILLSIGAGKPPESEIFAQMEEAAPIVRPAEAGATVPLTENLLDSKAQKIEALLPGLVDLSLSRASQPLNASLSLQQPQTASVPLHLRGRNIGDVRPPPGF